MNTYEINLNYPKEEVDAFENDLKNIKCVIKSKKINKSTKDTIIQINVPVDSQNEFIEYMEDNWLGCFGEKQNEYLIK